MNALARFYRFGAEDADRRIAALLAAPPLGVADRYLMSSVVVRGVDRVTRVLQAALVHSATGRTASAAQHAWRRSGWAERYRTIGVVLMVAVGAHVAATLLRGARPGWFWLIVPALISVFAVLALLMSRLTPSSK